MNTYRDMAEDLASAHFGQDDQPDYRQAQEKLEQQADVQRAFERIAFSVLGCCDNESEEQTMRDDLRLLAWAANAEMPK